MSLVKEEQDTLAARSFSGTAVRYPIGVAARLTGIQVETLRVWERRYGVIGPQVSATGRRLYAAADLERLRLIKQLVDGGHPISSVASVSSDTLRELRDVSVDRVGVKGNEGTSSLGLRAVLVGDAQRSSRGRGLAVAGVCADIERATTQFRGLEADVVIVELPSLLDLDVEEIDAIKAEVGARLVVVLYRFGASSTVRKIRKAGHVAAHAAVDEFGLNALCRMALLPAVPAYFPDEAGKRLDSATLEMLAKATTTIECECPKHMVELIRSLASFETYSEQCSMRSELDATLHHDLQQTAGRARMLLEQALLRLAMLEGVAVAGFPWMKPAWVFGLAGLIPFFGLAGMVVVGPEKFQTVAQVLLTQYGALILSFVGALHWGYAVQRDVQGGEAWLRYGFSVLPALWALLALQFTLLTAMQMLAVALIVSLIADMVFCRWSPLPAWFFRLRLILTSGGAASLLLASVI